MVNSRILGAEVRRDNIRGRTPMRCPLCGGELSNVHIRDLGGLTADIQWTLHAGHCPEHGWFQAEFSADPPREVFPVKKPFGTARRVVVDGTEYYEFRTAWGEAQIENRHVHTTDPLDPAMWATSVLTAGGDRG